VKRDLRRFNDLFRYFGPISVRRMFGGEGIYAGDLNRADFLAEDCWAFSFPCGEKNMVLPYYGVPERFLDNPEEFSASARKAHAAAIAAKMPGRKSR
jgi:DNA transformation protein and related proteins